MLYDSLLIDRRPFTITLYRIISFIWSVVNLSKDKFSFTIQMKV